jgi:hypothetical protein
MELQTKRTKRFERSSSPTVFQLTTRDLTLLVHVARHRFVTSSNLVALDGGSAQNVLRCLRVLFDHGYLDRIRLERRGDTPRPFVYALGQKGARALRDYGHHVDASVDWTEKNKRAGGVFIEHTLELADFMIRLELGCRERGDVRLISGRDIINTAPDETRTSREPLRWTIEKTLMGKRETFSVVPDGLFGLEFGDGTAAYFLLEIDRGTIPLRRTDVRGSTAWRKNIAYKLATYYEGWKAKQHERQFGLKQMRVAIVTTSPERLRNMLSIVDGVTEGKGTNFFLFVDQETLNNGHALAARWVTGKGGNLSLLE